MCDTLVSLTDDGVLFAKNSDRDPNEAQVLRWSPAATHSPGSRVRCTWSEIDQVPSTYAVLLSQPWWMWGAEIGANEHGVVIGNEAVFTRGGGKAKSDSPLLGMDLIRLALERAASTREAVGVIVDLLERHGQGGSCSHDHPRFTYDNSFIVADRDGAVVLETAGRDWATETVTGPGRSISNGLTIPHFAKRHSDPLRSRVASCSSRRALTESGASRATSVSDLFAVLRDHGPDGLHWSPLNGALSAPCAHAAGLVTTTQSTASWVADLRGEPVHWVTGTSAPCTSTFKPVRVDRPVDVDPEAMPSNAYDPAYRWWRHELLHRSSMRDHARALATFTSERDALERRWLDEAPDSANAFAEADALEAEWLRGVVAVTEQDRRPGWLRPLAQRIDRAADIDKEIA
jgi:dipeptidase